MIGGFIGMKNDYKPHPVSPDIPHIRISRDCTLERYTINVLTGIDMCSGTFYSNIWCAPGKFDKNKD